MERQADGMGMSHKKHSPSSLVPSELEDGADSQEGWGVSKPCLILQSKLDDSLHLIYSNCLNFKLT